MSYKQQPTWKSDRVEFIAEAQTKAQKRRARLNMILTIVLSLAIVSAGFAAPSVYYAVSDSERGNITVLPESNNSTSTLHVFDEPVSLYPWNLDGTNTTSSLSYTERNFLYDHNIPQFLITVMTVYGMNIELLEPSSGQVPFDYVSNLLVDSFSYLHTNSEDNQGCYVISSLDVNGDGTSDLRCAVDQNGVIISLLFLSDPWVAEPALDDTGEAEIPPPAQEGDGTEGVVTDPAVEGEPGADVEDGSYALNLEGVVRAPSGEERALWSFAHLIALAAAETGQNQLGAAAGLLDTGFSQQYFNPNTSNQNGGGKPDAEPAEEIYEPNAIPFTTEEYELSIYDLPNDVRFILYYNPNNSRCVGFNLQL